MKLAKPRIVTLGASLVAVQRLRLRASSARGASLIPVGELRSHMPCGVANKEIKIKIELPPSPSCQGPLSSSYPSDSLPSSLPPPSLPRSLGSKASWVSPAVGFQFPSDGRGGRGGPSHADESRRVRDLLAPQGATAAGQVR